MVECVSWATQHLFHGNPIADQARLRHKYVIEEMKWQLPSYEGMEWDQYDNPATVYFIERDNAGKIRGCARLYPTHIANYSHKGSPITYMVKDAFLDAVQNEEPPNLPECWETSRLVLDMSLPVEERRKIFAKLGVAYLEYGVSHGIKTFYGAMYEGMWRVWQKIGFEVSLLGKPICVDGDSTPIEAGKMSVSPEILELVRDTTCIYEPILDYGGQKNESCAFSGKLRAQRYG